MVVAASSLTQPSASMSMCQTGLTGRQGRKTGFPGLRPFRKGGIERIPASAIPLPVFERPTGTHCCLLVRAAATRLAVNRLADISKIIIAARK